MFQGPKGYIAQICEVHLQYGNNKMAVLHFFLVNSTLICILFSLFTWYCFESDLENSIHGEYLYKLYTWRIPLKTLYMENTFKNSIHGEYL